MRERVEINTERFLDAAYDINGSIACLNVVGPKSREMAALAVRAADRSLETTGTR